VASAVSRDPADPIRVAVVDDHPIALAGVEQVLLPFPDLRVVALAASVAELVPSLDAGRGDLDVLLLDLYLKDGPPAIAEVAQASRIVPVLVLSASRRGGDVLAAIRAGAAGYLTKHAAGDQFAQAIRTVAAGGFFVSPELADMIRTEPHAPPSPAPSLSARERETLTWIALGYTHDQTARRMSVSKATVDTYVQRIRVKLSLGNKAQLTRAAIEVLGPDLLDAR
jgi:DNA-binding NarL/FixJ family response regulator